MSNSFIQALQNLSIVKALGGGGQGVTVPVEDKTGGPIGPNLAGPRVSMPGPPVTIGQPPAPQEASQPWFNPDTSSVGNFLMKGASGQGNLMDTVNALAKPFYGTDVQGLGSIVQGIDRGTSAGMESVFPGTGEFLSNPLSVFGLGGGATAEQIPGMTPEQTQAMFQRFMQQKMGTGQQAGGGGGDGLGMLRGLAGGGRNTIDMGSVAPLPAPPTEAMPQGMDLSGYNQWLEKAAPAPIDEKAMQDTLLANYLGGMGAGLSNAAGATNIADVLLAAGGGSLQGVGRGKQDQQRMKDRQADDERRYAGMRANASLSEAQIKQKDAEAARAVETRNAERSYQHLLAMREEEKPKMLGASQDGLVYETNVGGKKQVHVWNSGNSAKLALARAMGGKQAMQQAGQAMGPLGPVHVLAQEVLQSGMADAIIGADNLEAIKSNAMEKMPQYQEGKMSDAAMNTYMEGGLVQMMLKNKGLMNTALQQFTMPQEDVPADIVKPAEKKRGR